ncbi:hypothetical protein CEXT_355661 [Caerostris extrusa]|uniref:Uncharacterized protein n=1 Tax=Caerostris extrusa TaxID=172846 RepID=A0AAV4M878_CAEEX|nr:hypothetical protein CEXT_355661 [Caerostris extrusa]
MILHGIGEKAFDLPRSKEAPSLPEEIRRKNLIYYGVKKLPLYRKRSEGSRSIIASIWVNPETASTDNNETHPRDTTCVEFSPTTARMINNGYQKAFDLPLCKEAPSLPEEIRRKAFDLARCKEAPWLPEEIRSEALDSCCAVTDNHWILLDSCVLKILG